MKMFAKIQLARKKKGLSQEELADKLNVSRQAVQKWESGASQPEISKLVQISEILNVSLDYLLKNEITPEQSQTSEKSETEKNNFENRSEPTNSVYDETYALKRKKAIKVWMIIGIVLTPLATGGSFLDNGRNPWAMWFLLLYLVTIPLGCLAIHSVYSSNCKSKTIKYGVLSLIFVSFIAGILILSTQEKAYIGGADLYSRKEKTLNEVEEEKAKILAEETARKQLEEKNKREEAIKEAERLFELKTSKRHEVCSAFKAFKRQKYNPSDIYKAEQEKNKSIKRIDSCLTDDDIRCVVDEYKRFLNTFSLDNQFYEKRKKKIKKFFSIFTPCVCGFCFLAILTGTVFVPLGKYNYAMSLIDQGIYEEANKYLDGNSWADSSQQIKISKARAYFDCGDYERGIEVLYNMNIEVNIDFDLNGGFGTSSDTIKKSLFINNKPSKEGYVFDKWLLESYSIGNSNINYKTNLILKASWKVIIYSITYNLNGGTASNPTSYNIESETITLTEPKRNGYTFVGWTGTDLNTKTKEVKINKGSIGDRVYYANWNANAYVINLELDGGECITNSVSVTYDSSFELPFPYKTGYTFLGWFEDENKWDSGIWKRTSNLILTAKWEITNFALSFDLNGGVCENLPNTYTYFDNDINISNPYRVGYEFTGWTGTDLNEPTKDLVISHNSLGDKEFIAHWKGLTYEIQFDSDGGLLDIDSLTVLYGEYCELPVPTKTGYTFEGWKYNGTTVNSGIWIIPNDITLKAEWTITVYNLCFDLDGGSIDVQTPKTYTYFTETIFINNPTKKGYLFTGWKDLNTSEVITSNLTIPNHSSGDKSYIALWNALAINVTFNPGEGTCSTSSQSYLFGSKVTLPVPTLNGYEFNGWWVDGYTIVYDGVWSIDHDVTLSAKWNKVPEKSTYPSLSWGYYPQTVEENSSILTSLETSFDIDGDGYLECSGNKYAKITCYDNSDRKSDSGSTTFTIGKTYYFKVTSIAWLGTPNGSSTSTSRVLHTRKVLDCRSFGSTNSYSSSSIKTYLEGTFYNKVFTAFEKKRAGKPYLASTPSDCYDYASGSGYPTDYAVCRGIALASNSKATVYWVTKTNGNDVCMGVSGETSSGYSTRPTDSTIGLRPLISFKF